MLQRLYAERLAALQDAGRAFVDGYRSGLEKAKEDSLLEEMADRLWRQTAPDKVGESSGSAAGSGPAAAGGPDEGREAAGRPASTAARQPSRADHAAAAPAISGTAPIDGGQHHGPRGDAGGVAKRGSVQLPPVHGSTAEGRLHSRQP